MESSDRGSISQLTHALAEDTDFDQPPAVQQRMNKTISLFGNARKPLQAKSPTKPLEEDSYNLSQTQMEARLGKKQHTDGHSSGGREKFDMRSANDTDRLTPIRQARPLHQININDSQGGDSQILYHQLPSEAINEKASHKGNTTFMVARRPSEVNVAKFIQAGLQKDTNNAVKGGDVDYGLVREYEGFASNIIETQKMKQDKHLKQFKTLPTGEIAEETQDSIMGRKKFAEIAGQTITDSDVFRQPMVVTKDANGRQILVTLDDHMKMTSGTVTPMGMTTPGTGMTAAATTQQPKQQKGVIVGRGLMNMVQANLGSTVAGMTGTTSPKKITKVFALGGGSSSRELYLSPSHTQQIRIPSSVGATDDLLTEDKGARTKEDVVSLEDIASKTGKTETTQHHRFNSKSALGVDTKKIASNSTFSQLLSPYQGDSNQNLLKQLEMQLPPLLKGGGGNPLASPDFNSQAQLRNESLTPGLQNLGNMQSQAPLQTPVGLDLSAALEPHNSPNKISKIMQTTFQTEVSGGVVVGAAGGNAQATAIMMNSTMPPLNQNRMIEMERQQVDGQKTRSSALKTPGQNWEQVRVTNASVLEYYNQNNQMLQTSIKQAFKKGMDRGSQVVRRNLKNVTEASQKKQLAATQNFASGKDATVAQISARLFDNIKPAPTFNERSRSMLSPKVTSVYSPVALTPVKDQGGAPSVATFASAIQQKRTSSFGLQKPSMKGLKVRKLGHIEEPQVDEKGKQVLKTSPTSPRINFPNPSLNINSSTKEVTMKKVKGGVTANRLDKTAEKVVDMPGRVVEEWIDAILKQDDNWENEADQKPAQDNEATDDDSSENSKDEKQNKMSSPLKKGFANASKGHDKEDYPGVQKFAKNNDSRGASVRYGIDFVSLTRNGLSSEQALRIQKSLYVHTIGFYDIIHECAQVKSTKKKDLIVGILRVYQQLLEKCHKTEWKMVLNEVAKTYELERDENKNMWDNIILGKDKLNAKLRSEIRKLQKDIQDLQQTVYSEKQAFARLHETYLILQHNNEDSLGLRMQTEYRLKDLFRRDREATKIMKDVHKAREQLKEELADSETLVQKLTSENEMLDSLVREKDGTIQLMRQQLAKEKRTNFKKQSKINNIEGPQKKLKAEEEKQRHRGNHYENETTRLELETAALKSQIAPMKNQLNGFKKENDHLTSLNNMITTNEEQWREKMHSALQELTDKTEMFVGAELSIAQKNQQLMRVEGKLKTNTNLMYTYELQKNNLANYLATAETRLKELEQVSQDQSAAMDTMTKHNHMRDIAYIDEVQRNQQLQEEFDRVDFELDKAETTTLFSLKMTIAENDAFIEKLQWENKTRKLDAEQAQKLANESNYRLTKQLSDLKETFFDMKDTVKKAHNAQKVLEREKIEFLSRQRDTRAELQQKENELQRLSRLVVDRDSRIKDLLVEIEEHKAVEQMYEGEMERRKAKKKAKQNEQERMNQGIHLQINKYDEQMMWAINQNIMMGEDYRSQAMNSYHKIVELQQQVCYLLAAPTLLKKKYLQLMTKHRREGELRLVEIEEERHVRMDYQKVIDGKDLEIKKLGERIEQHLYLIFVLRKKLGNEEFDLSHVYTQTDVVYANHSTQTEVKTKNRGIHAHGFNMRNQGIQTEIIQSDLLDSALGHYKGARMPHKKLKKGSKKNKKGSLSGSSKRSSVSSGSASVSPQRRDGQILLPLPSIEQKIRQKQTRRRNKSILQQSKRQSLGGNARTSFIPQPAQRDQYNGLDSDYQNMIHKLEYDAANIQMMDLPSPSLGTAKGSDQFDEEVQQQSRQNQSEQEQMASSMNRAMIGKFKLENKVIGPGVPAAIAERHSVFSSVAKPKGATSASIGSATTTTTGIKTFIRTAVIRDQ